jgi:sialate O-acetylesterase
MFRKIYPAVVVLLILAGARSASATVRLPHLFTDNMVLQRHAVIPVWGWATPGQNVTVRFAGRQAAAIADASGKWRVRMPPLPADRHGRTMVIAGDHRIVIHNVLVGDVWLCSGQSNMQFPVDGSWARALHARKEVAAADFPLIRLLKVPMSNTPKPQQDIKASWMICSPATVKDFSAVAYFFGRDLFRHIHVPIGLIDSSYGGTVIQSWTPMSALQRTPALHGDITWFAKAARRYAHEKLQYQKTMAAWNIAARYARAHGQAVPAHPHIKRPQNPFTLSRPSPDMAPVSIFNAMIHPLIPYAIRGVVWYQGENNAWINDRLYGVRLQAMIKGWRRNWAIPDAPFLIVQIAPYFHYPKPTVGVPLVWQAEEHAVRALRNTGIVGTTDIGDLHNIHFRDKQDVGTRLTLLALNMVYGHGPLRSVGPMYKSMRINGNKAIISFSNIQGRLASRDGQPLDWFQIAGANHKFIQAHARIVGQTVMVSAASVPHPVAVRFGWNCKAQPNLMDSAKMPVLPFRTDHWPLR